MFFLLFDLYCQDRRFVFTVPSLRMSNGGTLRATNAKMGPIANGRRKAESDTRAKCRLFEQRDDKVEKVEEERAPQRPSATRSHFSPKRNEQKLLLSPARLY
jgi:hypothetical protein